MILFRTIIHKFHFTDNYVGVSFTFHQDFLSLDIFVV